MNFSLEMQSLLDNLIILWIPLVILILILLIIPNSNFIRYSIIPMVVVLTVASIYKNMQDIGKPILGRPTENLIYVYHRLQYENKDIIAIIWARNLQTNQDRLFRFVTDEDSRKNLGEAYRRTIKGDMISFREGGLYQFKIPPPEYEK